MNYAHLLPYYAMPALPVKPSYYAQYIMLASLTVSFIGMHSVFHALALSFLATPMDLTQLIRMLNSILLEDLVQNTEDSHTLAESVDYLLTYYANIEGIYYA